MHAVDILSLSLHCAADLGLALHVRATSEEWLLLSNHPVTVDAYMTYPIVRQIVGPVVSDRV